jgi:CRP-like cAMP-binding protein
MLACTASEKSLELCQFLSAVSILQPLSKQEISKLSGALQVATFAAGEQVIRQGDEGKVFYIIKSGKVRAAPKAAG